MACKCLGAATPGATKYINCLRRYLGLNEFNEANWDENLHEKFLDRQSDFPEDVAALQSTPLTKEQIRALEFGGDQMGLVAQLVWTYPTKHIDAGDAFWTCVGVTKPEALEQMASGPYFDMATAAVTYINKRSASEFPWLYVGLGVAGAAVAAYFLLRK